MLYALISTLIIVLALICIGLFLYVLDLRDDVSKEKEAVKHQVGIVSEVCFQRDEYKSNLTKERGRNKSVEVRTGFIMEKIAPFTEAFGENPRTAKFLGDPIDFICFNEDEIVFVEVKTGKARLTTKQNRIKRLVEEGKVEFKTIRFDYE